MRRRPTAPPRCAPFRPTPIISMAAGLVAFRQGAYADAVADFTAALAINPKLVWALYGRGLAERHLGRAADGDRDIATAQGLSKTIAARAKRYGFV
jgi:Flp pilus assembly protein TadD